MARASVGCKIYAPTKLGATNGKELKCQFIVDELIPSFEVKSRCEQITFHHNLSRSNV